MMSVKLQTITGLNKCQKRQFNIKVTVTFTISVNFVTQLPLPVKMHVSLRTLF